MTTELDEEFKMTPIQRRAQFFTSIIFLVLALFCFFVIHYLWWSIGFFIIAVLSMTGFIAQEEYFKAEKEGWVEESKPITVKQSKKSKKKDENQN